MNISHYTMFLGMEIIFAVFILYYLVEEVLEIKSRKVYYFKSFHNILDLCIIVVRRTKYDKQDKVKYSYAIR